MSSGGGSEQKGWRQSNSHQNRQGSSRGGLSQRGGRNTESQSSSQPAQSATWSTVVDRSRTGSGPRGGPRTSTPSASAVPPNAAASQNSAHGMAEVTHVPVGGFNAGDVKEYLKRVQQDAIAGDVNRTAHWKPSGNSVPTKPNGPWGSKPSLMANGQDFWVQLKKQVAAKEQGSTGG